MTLNELKRNLDSNGISLINILYGLYYDLYSNKETSETLDDLGFYMIEFTNKYGKELAEEFIKSDEIKELKKYEQKMD